MTRTTVASHLLLIAIANASLLLLVEVDAVDWTVDVWLPVSYWKPSSVEIKLIHIPPKSSPTIVEKEHPAREKKEEEEGRKAGLFKFDYMISMEN